MNPLRWVVLPGLDGSGQLFRWFVECAARANIEIVRYPFEPDWRLDDYVAHIDATIGSGPCIVIAESFSGPIALRLQQRNPHIVGIALVASFVACPNPLLKMLPLGQLGARALTGLVAMVPLRALCLGWNAPAERVTALRDVIRAIPVDVVRARLALLRTLDERETLRRARIPILHLVAKHDRLVLAKLVGDSAHDALHQIVIDGPHFLLQACPEACVQAIEDWSRSAFPPEGADPTLRDAQR